MVPLTINPPLLNSANPWCTTLSQLQDLYNSPHTGAITTRTSLLNGFPHSPLHHQFTFYNPSTHAASTPNTDLSGDASTTGSLNTLGYSPLALSDYLDHVQAISNALGDAPPRGSKTFKPVIISVTGSVQDILSCYGQIRDKQQHVKMRLAMEVNLSCPNVPGHTPPAYDFPTLATYLAALKTDLDAGLVKMGGQADEQRVAIGIKIPPYTYQAQFDRLAGVLRESAGMKPVYLGCPVDFITAVNTLGSSLLLSRAEGSAAILPTLASANGSGVGGLAGAPLHPLALGNVYTIRALLDKHEELKHVMIIGVGGVEDQAGFERMKSVGAGAVGVGTALGRMGVAVFEKIVGG